MRRRNTRLTRGLTREYWSVWHLTKNAAEIELDSPIRKKRTLLSSAMFIGHGKTKTEMKRHLRRRARGRKDKRLEDQLSENKIYENLNTISKISECRLLNNLNEDLLRKCQKQGMMHIVNHQQLTTECKGTLTQSLLLIIIELCKCSFNILPSQVTYG